MTEIANRAELAEVVPEYLIHPETGETLAPTVENAALVIDWCRAAKRRLDTAIEAATAVVLEASRISGTKTLRHGDVEVTISGGPTVVYDPETLSETLRAAGCPEERIDAVVRAKVEYTVNKRVLAQLTGANEDYADAAERSSRTEARPWRAKVERR